MSTKTARSTKIVRETNGRKIYQHCKDVWDGKYGDDSGVIAEVWFWNDESRDFTDRDIEIEIRDETTRTDYLYSLNHYKYRREAGYILNGCQDDNNSEIVENFVDRPNQPEYRSDDPRDWNIDRFASRKLRSATIKLAHENPKLRPHLLPLLKQSGEFTEQAWKEHKKKYPGADAKDHTITKSDREKAIEIDKKMYEDAKKNLKELPQKEEDAYFAWRDAEVAYEEASESKKSELKAKMDKAKQDYDQLEDDLKQAKIDVAHYEKNKKASLLPLLKQSGEFTKDQWKEHKKKFPGAQAHMHTITDNPKSKSKSEDETETGPSVSQDMKDKVLKEWGIQHMVLMKHHINDLKTLKDVEDTLVEFRHRTHREEDKAVVGALKDIKEVLEKAEGEKSEKSEKKASLSKRASNWAKLFPRNSYLNKFFNEKRIPYKVFEKKDKHGVVHMIENGVVVEMIAQTSGGERQLIEDTIRKIDFHNRDLNHYFDHLAGAIADRYGSPF